MTPAGSPSQPLWADTGAGGTEVGLQREDRSGYGAHACACRSPERALERKARRARGPQTRLGPTRTRYAYCLPAVVAVATASSFLDSRVETMWSTMCSASRPTPPTSAELSE